MSPGKNPAAPPSPISVHCVRYSQTLAVGAAVGWFWAFALLATRDYPILLNSVLASVPPVWGFLALPGWKLAAALVASTVLAGCGAYVARQSGPAVSIITFRNASSGRSRKTSGRSGESRSLATPATTPAMTALHEVPIKAGPACLRPLVWLLLATMIPLLDVARAAGLPVPFTFYEPLLLAALTGQAVLEIARRWPLAQRTSETWPRLPWLTVTGLLTALAAAWWYFQGCQAYDNYLLGHHDFGHFAYRVVSTWQGRGFLLESPGAPAFWDHFNPGLALLAPLWSLWPDAKLFVLLQAVCLALPALLVFGIARAWGARPNAAAAWAVAYLAFPAVGQLNLNYSYGWHPVSLALPLMFLAAWLLLLRRYAPAVAAALLACSFKETVLVTLGCLAAVLAVQAWLSHSKRRPADQPPPPDSILANRLPWFAWLSVWGFVTLGFYLVVRLTPFAQFQTSRFANLGNTSFEIALSPLLRPRNFWGQMLSQNSLLFILALLVPLGFQAIRRGWLILSAAALPMVVLLAWEHLPATCIAFQYVTTLIPVLFLAAISGAACDQLTPDTPPATSTGPLQRGLLTAGVSAMAACLTASVLFGGLPWSSRTLVIMAARSYQIDGQQTDENPRAVGTPGNQRLAAIVDMVNRPGYAVLASGRVAAHLLHVRRLEAAGQAIVRWGDLCREAGRGCSGVEAFDWIVLDTYEVFQQSAENMQFIADEARRAGYREVPAGDGILVFARPTLP